MAMDYSSALRMINASRINDTYLQVCVQRRYSNLYSMCKELIQRCGKLYSAYAEYTLNFKKENLEKLGLRAKKDYAKGGAVIDLGYHTIDLINYLFGEPDSIYANLNFNSLGDDYNIEDGFKAIFKYKDVNLSILTTIIYSRKGERFRVFGQKGTVLLENRTVRLINHEHELLEEHTFYDKFQDIELQLDDFVKNASLKKFNDEKLQDQLKNILIIDYI